MEIIQKSLFSFIHQTCLLFNFLQHISLDTINKFQLQLIKSGPQYIIQNQRQRINNTIQLKTKQTFKMRTASYFPNQYLINNRLSSTSKVKLNNNNNKSKSKNKKISKDRLQKQKSCTETMTIKFMTQDLIKSNTQTKTRRNSLTFFTAQKQTLQRKESLAYTNKNIKIQQNQITKNLESQAKKYLILVKELISPFSKESNLNKHEKIRINQWLMKLEQPMHNDIWRLNRNFYLKVLIQMIRFGDISEPFSNVPGDGQLPKLNLYDVAFPIRERLLQKADNLNFNQKARSKSRKNSMQMNKSISKHLQILQKQNDANLGNIPKIKAGTKFSFDSDSQIKNSNQYQKHKNFFQGINKDRQINAQKSQNDHSYYQQSKNTINYKFNPKIELAKRKIFNQIQNISSIQHIFGNSTENEDSQQLCQYQYQHKNFTQNNHQNKTKKRGDFHTMKTQEFLKTSVQISNEQEDGSQQVEMQMEFQTRNSQQNSRQAQQNRLKALDGKLNQNNLAIGVKILSQFQLILWQRQKQLKNNAQYQQLMKSFSKLLNKIDKKSNKNKNEIKQPCNNRINNNNNYRHHHQQQLRGKPPQQIEVQTSLSLENKSKSFDISRLFNQRQLQQQIQSENNSFKILSQKVKSKFNKTGKDTKQFLNFLRGYQ